MLLYISINNSNVSRANIMATLVFKAEDSSYADAIIDDGTGKISMRSFERKDIFSKVEVGDAVLVVGKIREYNNEKYIIPEIVKKTDSEWIAVRRNELRSNSIGEPKQAEPEIYEGAEKIEEVFTLIRKLDLGDGVMIEDIAREFKNFDAEKMLGKMLENGDVFEIKPGKIKILE